MRVSWRMTVGILLVGTWPHLGCLHTQADKTVQDERSNTKSATTKKEAPTPVAQAAELERTGKYREAIAIYEKMRTPGNPDALLATKLLAGFYLRHNDLERAEQEYRTLLQQNPRDSAVLTSLGDISCRRALWPTAEMYYSEALKHQPENASARSGLAMALAQQGAYARSVEEFKKVVSEADAQCEVAFVMKMQHNDTEALKAYQTALTVEPAHARARSEVALLRQKGVTDAPATIVRMTTPMHKTGIAELEPAPARVASEGMSRQQAQRPTLPPLPEMVDTDGGEPNRQK
jgi:tetratricopeptide (TPR) repeat protein